MQRATIRRPIQEAVLIVVSVPIKRVIWGRLTPNGLEERIDLAREQQDRYDTQGQTLRPSKLNSLS